ncbi:MULTISPECIES: IS3 family transposase [Paraburkholderia]|uniref:IS3 family transposase n=1 Tax=Paraburkholderia franconis TaxID=2654983 RepID=A0A7X1NKU2_9BURK|nr:MULTISPECIES: IS3 family transposase [Paraburkholderia]MPW23707.1 IS3 family transposase [Paraburkholderia franconis]
MSKTKWARYTLEFKLEAVRLVKAGQSIAAVAATLDVPTQSISNWVKAEHEGKLGGAGTKPVSPEQMELSRLRAEVARLKMERDILKKALRVLREGVDVKYAFIERNRRHWPISVLCEVLDVSPSGYHQRRQRTAQDKPGRSRVSDDALLAHIKAIHSQVKGEYGWPRMWKELLARGVRVGKERVRKLMAQHGIRARHKRKYIATTNSNHGLPVAPNLLERNFTATAPNQVWTSDITYVATAEGWLYLAVIIDLFSRQVVGWSMQPHMKAELVTDALRMAWFRRHPEADVIVHSDRGSQYCSGLFQDTLKAYGMRSSMSRRGDCWDNAPTESLWGSLKVARLHGRHFPTKRAAMDEVVDWLNFYNAHRLHSTLNYVSPMTFEKNWFAAQQGAAA